ncbi:MAG: hypothetical protein IPL53_09435 [Ignavibacteria bacterium]|nr:hypothetical protein [Ignavibacteria bacterium]
MSQISVSSVPDDEIVKAQVIEYYFKIAPTILNHVKEDLFHWYAPDGIYWREILSEEPSGLGSGWIRYVAPGSNPQRTKDYILATEEAVLVAC